MEICFHFRNAHTTAFQAVQTLNPFDVMFVKDTIISSVTLDIGDQSLVAVEFQSRVGQIQFPADLHHCIHRLTPPVVSTKSH